MTVTPDQVVAEAKKYLGWPYGYRDRCGGSYHELDCSGLICKVLNTLGIYVGCITSFQFAQMAWDHGLVVPKQVAMQYPTLLIEGPNGGRGPSQRANGSDGHIVLGNMTYTIEERGHAYGCVEVPLDLNRANSSFAIATWIPGVNYTAPSTRQTREQDMLIQFKDGKGNPKKGSPSGRKPVVGVSADGTYIEEWNGASIWGDQHNSGDPSNKRRWYPKAGDGKSLFLAPGHKYIGIARHKGDTGITAVVDDGGTVDQIWS
jgi:hypothetical protein